MKKLTFFILFISFIINGTKNAYDRKIESLLKLYPNNPTQFFLRLRYYELQQQPTLEKKQYTKILNRLIWAIDNLKTHNRSMSREKIEKAFLYIQAERYNKAWEILE